MNLPSIAEVDIMDLDAVKQLFHAHLDVCDDCNLDKEDCPCTFDEEVVDHSCNCSYGPGWGVQVRRIIKRKSREFLITVARRDKCLLYNASKMIWRTPRQLAEETDIKILDGLWRLSGAKEAEARLLYLEAAARKSDMELDEFRKMLWEIA